MTSVLIDLTMVALLVVGLERNRARQRWTRLSGSTDVQDRDRERIQAELLGR